MTGRHPRQGALGVVEGSVAGNRRGPCAIVRHLARAVSAIMAWPRGRHDGPSGPRPKISRPASGPDLGGRRPRPGLYQSRHRPEGRGRGGAVGEAFRSHATAPMMGRFPPIDGRGRGRTHDGGSRSGHGSTPSRRPPGRVCLGLPRRGLVDLDRLRRGARATGADRPSGSPRRRSAGRSTWATPAGTSPSSPTPRPGATSSSSTTPSPPGTAAGVWTKGFPAGLADGGVDVVRAAVKAADPESIRRVAVALEIKGTAGIQRIPLETQAGWSPASGPAGLEGDRGVDGGRGLGQPRRRRCARRRGRCSSTSGSNALSPLRKLACRRPRDSAASPWRRARGGPGGLLRFAMRPEARGDVGGPGAGPASRGSGSSPSRPWRSAIDLIGRSGTAGGRLGAGLARAGGGVARGVVEVRPHRRHLTAGEAFRDALATGLLAASSSPLAILQAPANWSDLLVLSQPVAAAVAFLYHAANAIRLATSGRHLGAIGRGDDRRDAVRRRLAPAAGIGRPGAVAGRASSRPAPWPTGPRRPSSSGGSSSCSASTSWWPTPSGWRRSGRLLRSAPGPPGAPGRRGRGGRRARGSRRSGRDATVDVVAGARSGWSAVVAATVLSQAGLWAEAYLLTGMVIDAIHGTAPSRESTVGASRRSA